MKTSLFAVLFLLSMPVAMPALVRAEESETEVAASEDKEAEALPGEIQSALKGINFHGTYTAVKGDEQTAVLGTFKDSDHTYIVKADTDAAKKLLAAVSGKVCTVYGKLRNKGKYLIVMNVMGEDDPQINRRKKKGF